LSHVEVRDKLELAAISVVSRFPNPGYPAALSGVRGRKLILTDLDPGKIPPGHV
jgi:hypothetical protein